METLRERIARWLYPECVHYKVWASCRKTELREQAQRIERLESELHLLREEKQKLIANNKRLLAEKRALQKQSNRTK